MSTGTHWIVKLAEVVSEAERHHPRLKVVGFRSGSALDLEDPENQGLSFIPAAECGGWLAMREKP